MCDRVSTSTTATQSLLKAHRLHGCVGTEQATEGRLVKEMEGKERGEGLSWSGTGTEAGVGDGTEQNHTDGRLLAVIVFAFSDHVVVVVVNIQGTRSSFAWNRQHLRYASLDSGHKRVGARVE